MPLLQLQLPHRRQPRHPLLLREHNSHKRHRAQSMLPRHRHPRRRWSLLRQLHLQAQVQARAVLDPLAAGRTSLLVPSHAHHFLANTAQLLPIGSGLMDILVFRTYQVSSDWVCPLPLATLKLPYRDPVALVIHSAHTLALQVTKSLNGRMHRALPGNLLEACIAIAMECLSSHRPALSNCASQALAVSQSRTPWAKLFLFAVRITLELSQKLLP